MNRAQYDQIPGDVMSFKPEVGMVDPYLNEVVTHVAELDEDAIRRQTQSAIIPILVFTIIFPCFWIMACLVWYINEHRTTAAIQGTQVYLTEHTLVFTMGNLPIESSRVTIPLANIASVMVQPGALTVNIKPTAPEVMMNRIYTTGGQHSSTIMTAFATRSVPVYYVYNAEEFGKVIQSNLQ